MKCLCDLPRAPMVVATTGRGARLCLLTLVPLALRSQLLLLHRADHGDSQPQGRTLVTVRPQRVHSGRTDRQRLCSTG